MPFYVTKYGTAFLLPQYWKRLICIGLASLLLLTVPLPENMTSEQGQHTGEALYAVMGACLPGVSDAWAGGRRHPKKKAFHTYRQKRQYHASVFQQKKGKKKKKFAARASLQRPVEGSISSPFGIRKAPFRRGYRMHKGMDIPARIGTPICAAEDGFICFAQRQGAYGLCVEINHGQGLSTKYAHMKRVCVRPGQHVEQGDIIGYVGMTGRTTGPHLHFEVLRDDVPMNPLYFLKN